MSLALLGGLVGLAFAIAEYFLFGVLIDRAARRGEPGRGPRILDMVRKTQLALFPIAGFVVGSMLETSGAL